VAGVSGFRGLFYKPLGKEVVLANPERKMWGLKYCIAVRLSFAGIAKHLRECRGKGLLLRTSRLGITTNWNVPRGQLVAVCSLTSGKSKYNGYSSLYNFIRPKNVGCSAAAQVNEVHK
jgi:hypothetical protein